MSNPEEKNEPALSILREAAFFFFWRHTSPKMLLKEQRDCRINGKSSARPMCLYPGAKSTPECPGREGEG